MMKLISSQLAIFIFSLVALIQVANSAEFAGLPANGLRQQWLTDSNHHQNHLLKRWFVKRPVDSAAETRSAASPFDALRTSHQFKGCIDPSEPFQCPQSERCIALQFICDGHAGDCPGNLDENEETCIAVKRPAKENIENFLHAAYVLHGSQLFTFLFGEKLSNSIEKNKSFWLDTLASAFSVAKNINSFAKRLRMSSDDVEHFRDVIGKIHDGRLEEIPLVAQEAVNQGLASLIEKLYESGFMEE
ncbi:unnamed protein product [Rotaria sordida]|uniref:Prohormone-4 n=1 Tax=Rotaria sordida TaxID=392033 RepID=A0A815KFR6_9BILA|nr:unnamed protein product [Rotaria sordida]CAF1413582.1 unnamed protein product [Rotaria sordida]CAF3577846.1 unnamed protein product [Rotaria sordida]CAF4021802.1 unnamed protein product [Rotaria sordida]